MTLFSGGFPFESLPTCFTLEWVYSKVSRDLTKCTARSPPSQISRLYNYIYYTAGQAAAHLLRRAVGYVWPRTDSARRLTSHLHAMSTRPIVAQSPNRQIASSPNRRPIVGKLPKGMVVRNRRKVSTNGIATKFGNGQVRQCALVLC